MLETQKSLHALLSVLPCSLEPRAPSQTMCMQELQNITGSCLGSPQGAVNFSQILVRDMSPVHFALQETGSGHWKPPGNCFAGA